MNRLIYTLVMLSTLVFLAATKSDWPKGDEMEKALLNTLDTQFYDSELKAWKEMVGKQDHVFLWGYTVLLSTFAIGAKVDPVTYCSRMEAAFEGLEKFWTAKAPGGYAVLPGQGRNPDRYYDDNAWVGLSAMEAYDVTKDSKYLDVADRALTFVVSGEDEQLGGGIYWHENERNTKNACVSGPGACLAYRLFLVRRNPKYRAMGDRWLAWTEKLVDKKDGLVMDNMKLDGKIERTKWSYNSAMLMQAYTLKNEIESGQASDLKDKEIPGLVRLFDNSTSKWIDGKTNLVSNPGMFAMHLLESCQTFSQLNHRAHSRQVDLRPICEAVYTKCRNAEGVLGEWWNRAPQPKEQLKLMYTASLLRTVLLAK